MGLLASGKPSPWKAAIVLQLWEELAEKEEIR
jgi:hypothetical protein